MKSRRRTSVEKRDIYIVGGICLCNGALFWRSNGRFILFVKLLMQEGAIDGCFSGCLFSYQYHCAIHITCLRHDPECEGSKSLTLERSSPLTFHRCIAAKRKLRFRRMTRQEPAHKYNPFLLHICLPLYNTSRFSFNAVP